MNAPLPLPAIAPSAPVSPADAFGAKTSVSDNKGPSFSEVLAQQRPTQSNDARPTGNGAKEPAPGKTGGSPEGHAENAASGAIDEAVEKAAQAEAGAMAVAAAQQPVPQALLPQQALEIAAQAAITAASGTAAVLVNALNANEVTPTPRAPVPLTAQAQAAAARDARDAELAVPVVTAAAKPGSQPAAVTADIKSIARPPRLSADAALPRTAPRTAVEAAQASQAGAQQPARQRNPPRCRPQRRRSSCPSTPPACRTIWRNRWPSRPSASSRCPCSTPPASVSRRSRCRSPRPSAPRTGARTWASNWS